MAVSQSGSQNLSFTPNLLLWVFHPDMNHLWLLNGHYTATTITPLAEYVTGTCLLSSKFGQGSSLFLE